MNCLHIISGDLWAGAEVATFHLLCELQRRRRSICVLILNQGELASRLEARGIQTIVVPESTHSFPALAAETVRLARRLRPVIIHSHRYKEHLLGGLAALACGGRHVRTSHGGFTPGERASRRTSAAAWVDRALTLITGGYWVAVAADLQPMLAGPRQSIVVIPNGLPDLPPTARRDLIEDAFATRADAWWIGYVGRLESEKRPDRFVRVVGQLPRSIAGREVRAVVVGQGSVRTELEQQIERLGMHDRVRLLGARADADALIGALDLLVIPSDREGHPMVMLEAMRAGVPIVASAVGGIIESLGPSPYLRSPEDEPGMAAAIEVLIRDEPLRGAWSQKLRILFQQNYSISTTADRLQRYYDEVSA
jgi:glycosyltransferase involved in cell wall biosynthesis